MGPENLQDKIRVAIIAHDQGVIEACREVVGEYPSVSVACGATPPSPETDLYIWDLDDNASLPPGALKTPARYLFLIGRHDLPALRQQDGGALNVLLKPLVRATLRAFIGLAVSAWQERKAATSSREDRDEILQCLIETNLRLQEYDQDRTNFLARALHDFRAPLTALNGYCGLLLGEPLGPLSESQREVIQRMQYSAHRLSVMATGMFQLSVASQVKRRPELRRGDIHECVDQALHEISPLAEEKRISITASLDSPAKPLYFEPGHIVQVLVNILDNACKFAPRGGAVEIKGYSCFWDRRSSEDRHGGVERRLRASADTNAYRVDISDNGAPIPPERLAHIFEEYTSYGGGRDRSGSGLGLAICKMIVGEHGGRIFASNTEGGPTFSFIIPVIRDETGGGAQDGFEESCATVQEVM